MRDELTKGLLAITPHFTVHREPPDTILLFAEDRSVRLRGEFYLNLLPLLNGTLTGGEIAAKLPNPELPGILETLHDKGQIAIMAANAAHHRQAFWSAGGETPADQESLLAGHRVAVVALGQTEPAGQSAAAAMIAGLHGAGLSVADAGTADLTVVLVDDYLAPGVRRFAETHGRDRAWLPVKPGGRRAMIGPILGGDDGGCFSCLTRRFAEQRPNDALIDRTIATPRPAKAWFSASVELARATTLLEVTGHALHETVAVDNHVLSLNTRTGERRSHRHWRYLDCPDCGQPATGEPAATPIALQDGEIIDNEVGGWRAWTTEEALEKLEPLVSDITGIISSIAQAPDFAHGLYVYNAVQATPNAVEHIYNRKVGNPGSASGKGLTPSQARVSCIAEAVERYSCGWTGTEARKRARLADLGDDAWHPHKLLNFSDHQYDNRKAINAIAGPLHKVPIRFDETAEIEWSPVWSLTDGRQKWLPTRFCYFGYTPRDVPGDHPFCSGDSNGCASGATLAEAILQGALELVERDAVAIWWYNRLHRPAIRLDGIRDEYVDRMVKRYDALGREIHLLDLTVDLGVPVVVAVTVMKDGKSRPLMGFGAHFDPRIAAERALTELNQIIMFDRPEAAEKSKKEFGNTLDDWLAGATFESEPYIAGDGSPLRNVDDMAHVDAPSLDAAVATMLDIFTKAGMEMMVLDYARSDMPLSSVKVVAPGMRHFWSRRGPGRLIDVPAQLGWLPAPNREDELNPLDFVL